MFLLVYALRFDSLLLWQWTVMNHFHQEKVPRAGKYASPRTGFLWEFALIDVKEIVLPMAV